MSDGGDISDEPNTLRTRIANTTMPDTELSTLRALIAANTSDIRLLQQETVHARVDLKGDLDRVRGDVAHGLRRAQSETADLRSVACTREALESSNALTQEKLDSLSEKVDILLNAAKWVIGVVLGSVTFAILALVLNKGGAH